MTRGLYLSYWDASEIATEIEAKTALTTEISDYEWPINWHYVTVYDNEGHVVHEVDTREEANELIDAYRED